MIDVAEIPSTANALMQVMTAATAKAGRGPQNRGLAMDLMRCMWRAREADTSVPRTEAVAAIVAGMFAENTEVLCKIMAEHGWPGYGLVGEKAAQAAWYIAQYCSDLAVQDQALHLLEKAVRDDDANPEHYALLADRICFNRREPQRFGTLYIPDGAGRLVLYQVRDRLRLDDRRHAMRLGSHAGYEAELRKWDERSNSAGSRHP